MIRKSAQTIQTQAVRACPICGSKERHTIYKNLIDRLFSAPGQWTFKQCERCGLFYLDPIAIAQDIALTYTNAYAQRKSIRPSETKTVLAKAKNSIRNSYMAWAYGYLQNANPWYRLMALPVMFSPKYREQI